MEPDGAHFKLRLPVFRFYGKVKLFEVDPRIQMDFVGLLQYRGAVKEAPNMRMKIGHLGINEAVFRFFRASPEGIEGQPSIFVKGVGQSGPAFFFALVRRSEAHRKDEREVQWIDEPGHGFPFDQKCEGKSYVWRKFFVKG